MKITQMRYAVAVAKERNFSRAAELCHVSQPSLSVAIKQLEEELDTLLFERFRNDVRVTEAGKLLLQQMTKILADVDQVKHLAELRPGSLSGSLRFGAIYSIGPYLFPTLVPKLHGLAPDMTLIVEENFTSVLSDRLLSGDLDAIIVALPFDEPGVEVQPVYDEPFVAAVSSGHAWAERDSVIPSELNGEKLLLLGKGHCFRDQVLDICGAASDGLADDAPDEDGFHNVIESNSLETIRHMIAVGTGMSVMPASSINSFLCLSVSCPERRQQTVRYLPFDDPAPFRRIAVAWRSSFPNRLAIDQLISAVGSAHPAGTRLITPVDLAKKPVGWGASSRCE